MAQDTHQNVTIAKPSLIVIFSFLGFRENFKAKPMTPDAMIDMANAHTSSLVPYERDTPNGMNSILERSIMRFPRVCNTKGMFIF